MKHLPFPHPTWRAYAGNHFCLYRDIQVTYKKHRSIQITLH